MNPPRNFLVSAEIKRVGLFRRVVLISITDGYHDLKFVNSGGFEVATDKPLKEPVLRRYH